MIYYAFFKENNHIGGKHYYAIVKANSTATKYELGYKKAGVSDYDGAATLKDQILSETRTSAFAIEPETLRFTVVSVLLNLKVMKVTRPILYVLSRNTVKNTCRLRIIRTS